MPPARLVIGALTCASFVVAGASGWAQSPSPAATSAVSGVVRDARTRTPIEGVQVQLSATVRANGSYQLTDQKGRFIFSGLTAGAYRIQVHKMGYTDGGYGSVSLRDSSARSFALAAGEWFPSADIDLTKLGAIGGRVVDENGDPVIALYVRAVRRFNFSGAERLAAGPVTKTDDRGEYRFDELIPGDYFVMIPSVQQGAPAVGPSVAGGQAVESQSSLILGNYLPASRAGAYPSIIHPGVQSIRSAVPIAIEGDERTGLDFTMKPVHTVGLAGRLTGGLASYAGYLLRLVPEGLEDLGNGSEAATTWAKPDGSFLFPAVPAGDYRLSAPGSVFGFVLQPGVYRQDPLLPRVPGIKPAAGALGGVVEGVPFTRYDTFVVDLPNDPMAGYANMPISVRDTDIVGLDVPLLRSATVDGRVTLDEEATLPQGIRIELAAADGSAELGVRVVSARTDGTFSIPVVIPGEYAINVLTTTGAVIRTMRVNEREATKLPVILGSGETADVKIGLTAKGGSLSGIVRDSTGSLVPWGDVIVVPTNSQLWQHYGMAPTWIYTATVRRDGRYDINNIRAGEYYVLAVGPSASAAWTDVAFLGTATATAARLTVDWSAVKHQDLVTVKR